MKLGVLGSNGSLSHELCNSECPTLPAPSKTVKPSVRYRVAQEKHLATVSQIVTKYLTR